MALARLYQQGGMERSAITSYKEVLRVRNLLVLAAKIKTKHICPHNYHIAFSPIR